MKKNHFHDTNNLLAKFYLRRLIQESFDKILLLDSKFLEPRENGKLIYLVDSINLELINSFTIDKTYFNLVSNLAYNDHMFRFNLIFSNLDIFASKFKVGFQQNYNLEFKGIAIFTNQSHVSLPILYLNALIISFDCNISNKKQTIIFDNYNKLKHIKFDHKKINIFTENNFVFKELFGHLSSLFHYFTPC